MVLADELPECPPVFMSCLRGLGDVTVIGKQKIFNVSSLKLGLGFTEGGRARCRCSARQVQVVAFDYLAFGERHGALDQMLQLAYVARPPVIREQLQGFSGKAERRLIELGGVPGQKMVC